MRKPDLGDLAFSGEIYARTGAEVVADAGDLFVAGMTKDTLVMLFPEG